MSNSIPDYGTRRTMWKHPDRIWAYFVTDEDRANGYITYLSIWEAVGGSYDAPGRITYKPSELAFFPEPTPKRRR